MELKEALKQSGLDVGFDLVGVAPLVPGKDLVFARQWVARGFGGEMRYLGNPKRFDPRLLLPSAKSVVCVGLAYNTPLPYSTDVHQEGSRQKAVGGEALTRPAGGGPPSPTGRGDAGEGMARAWISRYAWGQDYHEIVRAKLEKLRAAVEELAPGVVTRAFVDTGPLVERAFARFSALGWMGKNTCIINEARGSWLFLGVLLTNLELAPDSPAPDRCGSCTACLEACPTGALLEPYVMDASRCISYLTIELKGSIPEQLRRAMGANVFGCDICQDVCPWNEKSRRQESEARSKEGGFEPLVVNRQSPIANRQSLTPSTQNPEPSTFSLFNPPLEALASLSADDFRRIFARSPLRRAKYPGWLRNLCVAMGNSGDSQFVPWLARASNDADPIIREHAAWALQRLRMDKR